jgi:hypothetical protein
MNKTDQQKDDNTTSLSSGGGGNHALNHQSSTISEYFCNEFVGPNFFKAHDTHHCDALEIKKELST